MFSLFYENKHLVSLSRSSFHIKQAKLTVNHQNDGSSTRVVAVAALIASWKPNSPLQLGRIAFESTARCRSRYFTSGECKSSAICTTRSAAQRVQGCETLNFARRLFLAARHTAVGDILIAGNWRIIPRSRASSVSLIQIAAGSHLLLFLELPFATSRATRLCTTSRNRN